MGSSPISGNTKVYNKNVVEVQGFYYSHFVVSIVRVFFLITFIVLVILSNVLFVEVRDRVNYRKELIETALTLKVWALQRWFQSQQVGLNLIATDPYVQDFLKHFATTQEIDGESFEQLSAIANSVPYDFFLITYFENDYRALIKMQDNQYHFIQSGSIVFRHNRNDADNALGLNVIFREYYEKIFKEGYDFYYSDGLFNLIDRETRGVVFAHKVEKEGEPVGAVLFFVDLLDFTATFTDFSMGETGQTFFIDSDSVFLGHSLNTNKILTHLTTADNFPSLEEIKNTLHLRSYEGQDRKRYFYYSMDVSQNLPMARPSYIVFKQEAREILTPIFYSVRNLIFTLVVTLAVTILLFWLVIRYFLISIVKVQREMVVTSNLLHEMNITDKLTGLYNRYYFDTVAAVVEQNQQPCAIIMCDLDGLKLMNDAFGHSEGDVLLNQAKTVLKGALPKYQIARLGGDEFAVILDNVTEEEAEHKLQYIKQCIAFYNKNDNLQMVPVSISVGLAYKQAEQKFAEALEYADQQLYAIKLVQSPYIKKQVLGIFEGYINELFPNKKKRLAIIERLCTEVASFYEGGLLKTADLCALVRYYNLGEVVTLGLDGDSSLKAVTESGYRIAMYIPEISGIADLILKQNEYYDGSGLLQLEAENIPLECRIFAACHMFDQYVVDHDLNYAIYRISNRDASLFDPLVVSHLLEVIPFVYNNYQSL